MDSQLIAFTEGDPERRERVGYRPWLIGTCGRMENYGWIADLGGNVGGRS